MMSNSPGGDMVLLAAAQALPFGIAIANLQGNVTWANAAYAQLAGCTLDELPGQSAGDLEWGALASAGSSSHPWCSEVVSRSRDGEPYTAKYTVTALRGSSGKAAGFWITKEQITEPGPVVLLQTNEAVSQAERHYRQLFNSVSDAVVVCRLENDGLSSRISDVNEKACSFLGYTREELLRMRIADIDAPEHRAGAPAIAQQLFTSGHLTKEQEIVAKDGRRLPVEINIHVFDLDGSPTMISCIRDISERKEAERQYRDIFEGALEGIYRTSIDKRQFLAANSALARMLGYDSPQDLIATITDTNVQLWLDPNDRSSSAALLAERGRVRDIECQVKRKDGTALWVSINAQLVYGVDGRPLYYDGFIQDITGRKRMHDALLRSEEKFARAFQSSPAAITICDLTNYNRIIDVNETFEAITGYRRNEAVGRNADELGLWPIASEVAESIRQFQAAGRLRNFEQHFRRKNGDVAIGLSSVDPIELDGKRCVISATLDITEQKQAEFAIRQADEAAAKAERHYRLMFNSVSDALFVHKFGEDGLPSHFHEVNDNACRYLGYTREELLQIGVSDIDAPEEHVALALRAQKLRADGHLMWEGVHISKDGRRIPVEINTHLVDLDGEQTIISSVRDISDRKIAEKQYREIFDGALEGIYRTTLDGRNLAANAALARILGFDSPDHMVSSVTDSAQQVWVNPAERAEFLRLLQQDGFARGYECQYRRTDGTTIWVSLNSRMVYDGDGEPLYTEGFIEDIAERKRMQDALRRSAETLAKLFRSSPTTTMLFKLVDTEYRITDVNEAFEQRTGYRRDEVVGRTLDELGLFADPNEELEYLKRFRANGRVSSFEHRYRTKNGGIGVCLSSAESIEIDGSPHVIAATVDITEQKKIEQTMRSLVTAIEQSADTIVITDLEGIIQYCNPAFERASGYSRQEAIGQNPRILRSGKQDTALYQRLWAKITNGEVWTGTLINKRKDGTFYEEDATISPIRDVRGKITGFVAAKRDITKQRQLEDQLRQAQKMESIGRLAGGVAHDFNNLLTVINGYSALMLERLPPDDPLRNYTEQILRAGERATGLTKQLLAFSRKQVIQPRVMDLNTAIRESVPMLQRLIGEDITLEASLSDSLGQVMADPDQFHQVIMNLAVNARDAMPNGGKLILETVNIELDEASGVAVHPSADPGRYVLMTVTDTGPGMDETIRRQIFEPFFTTKELGKGTGLGLSTVYGIIRQSGGFIDVSSKVGVGTWFRIYLPRTDAASLPNQPGVSGKAEEGNETVLVVEDQEAVLAFASAALEECGYRVIEASSAEAAVTAFEEQPGKIDLLLTDVVLPGMNGKELSQKLRALRPDLKVLFTSGYTGDVIGRRGVLDDGVSYLPKPFTPEELTAKVRSVLAET